MSSISVLEYCPDAMYYSCFLPSPLDGWLPPDFIKDPEHGRIDLSKYDLIC